MNKTIRYIPCGHTVLIKEGDKSLQNATTRNKGVVEIASTTCPVCKSQYEECSNKYPTFDNY